jgi:uncharacterized repeat protein (TIGR01451 family)
MLPRRTALLACALLAVAGCERSARTTEFAAEPRGPRDGVQKSVVSVPTGHRFSSVLQVERDLPRQVIAGQEFEYRISVRNVGNHPLNGVTIRDECADNFKMTRSEPAAIGDGSEFLWPIGTLEPGQIRTVRVYGKVTGAEPFTSCANATYDESVCLTADVVQPRLAVAMAIPDFATPCDTLPVNIIVSNTGTGEIRSARVDYTLPAGWTTSDGKNTAILDAGTLGAGASKELRIQVKPGRTGDFTSRAVAEGEPGLKAESLSMPTSVRQAVLDLKTTAPQESYVGRPATVHFVVSNKGSAEATGATVEAQLPRGAKFISATEGGVLRGNSVVWTFPQLPLNAPRTLAMSLEPGSTGELDAKATAKAYCATVVSDTSSFAVKGIPALLLELIDLHDPVEVGRDTTYQVVVTNQGSAPATNVRLVANLESAQRFVSATGIAAYPEGSTVVFQPIATIPPGGKATVRIVVNCVTEGDIRFRISMISDQLQRPVEESESTYVYR